jgi:putative spermidine/putrescine transport system ATP-binding protein
VAGFVGVSNLVSGELAQAITGSPETFSVRPEKIHLGDPDAPVPGDMYGADGRIREVVYLGLYTRYIVELEQGGELTVVEQNLHTTSMEALAARGRRVRLTWSQGHNQAVAENG